MSRYARARERADAWNEANPVGVEVVATGHGGREDYTTTTSAAWEQGGEAWVLLDGDRVPWRLELVEPA